MGLSSLEICFVLTGSHKVVKFSGIGHLYHQHPTIFVGILVDQFRAVLQFFIDFNDFTADRRNKLRGCLDRFDITELGLVRNSLSRAPGQFDIDDIAKLILGVISDADGRLVVLDADPFVRFAVFEISRMIEASHGVYLPSLVPRAGALPASQAGYPVWGIGIPGPTFFGVY